MGRRKIAIFGGSGFMGYDLARRLHEGDDYEPVVYSTSPKSLVNLARHPIEIRLVRYPDLDHALLDKDVHAVVNFAHPFGNRDALSVSRQVEILSDFIARNLERHRDLRAIHVSSMSVYEPFAGGREFSESARLRAPRSDRYARSKCDFEARLASQPEFADRLLVLRPTVVYGPFCRPWTDALLAGFGAGDVEYRDLGGRIQPLLVTDVSRFVEARLADFAPGVFNLAGPQALPWHEFLNFFGNVVGRGRLVERARGQETSSGGHPLRTLAEIARLTLGQSRVKELLRPVAAHLPARWVETLKYRLKDNLGVLARSVTPGASPPGPYCDAFFAHDRLVSTRNTTARFPDFEATPLEGSREWLGRYHRFRFRDEVLT